MAVSIDDVAPILGREDFTDFLMPMAIAGHARRAHRSQGRLGPLDDVPDRGGLRRPDRAARRRRHPGPGRRTLPGLTRRRRRRSSRPSSTSRSSTCRSTNEYGHYLLVLGLFVWATSMFAAYAVFGHRRPLNAIVIVGSVLLVNMSLTTRDQLLLLVLFSIASLLLLIRYHVLEEQAEWVRRRIGDPASISSIYLRGGTLFIVGGDRRLAAAHERRVVGAAAGRLGRGQRRPHRAVALVPEVPADGRQQRVVRRRLRPVRHEHRRPLEPGRLPRGDDPAAAGREAGPLLARRRPSTSSPSTAGEPSEGVEARGSPARRCSQDTAEAPNPELHRTADLHGHAGPGRRAPRPLAADPGPRSTRRRPSGSSATGPFIDSIERDGDGPYTVTALVPIAGDEPGELNQETLRAAGTDYPVEVTDLYLEVPDGAIPAGGCGRGAATTSSSPRRRR